MIYSIIFLYIIFLHLMLCIQQRKLYYINLRQKSHENVTLSLAHVVQQIGQKLKEEKPRNDQAYH